MNACVDAKRSAPPPPALELQQVSHAYDGRPATLHGLDLHIQAGEFVSLLGPSGCGKSTLLRIMAGLVRPSSGTVRREGHVLQGPGATATAAGLQVPSFVFQEPTLMPWANVQSNVGLPLALQGVSKPQARERVQAALAQVGLERVATWLPMALSGGMQMRVSIARALVTDPNLLLMDEPFAALDEITRNRLDDDLLQLWRQRGLTVVFVTHSVLEAAFVSSRVLVMGKQAGRIVADVPLRHPWPRDAHYRTSSEFNAMVRELQDSLAVASQPQGQGDAHG